MWHELGLGSGLDNWFCCLSVCLSSSSSLSSFGAAEQGAGGKEVRTWCGKRRRRRGEKEVSKQREVAMRLITHNMLSCNIKGVTNGYPLGIEASRLETKESELNPEFLRKIFPKLEWKALRDAAHSVCVYAGFFFFLYLRFQHVCIDVVGPFAHLGNGFCICSSLAETLSFTPCLAVFHLPKAYWIGSLFGKLKFFGVPRSVLFVNRKNGTSVEGIIAGGHGWNHLLQVSLNFLVCMDYSWD